MQESYIAQRLTALTNGLSTDDIDKLKAENQQLKELLTQVSGDFKSEAQKNFERSFEYENVLNAFYLRFLRDRFISEFRTSPYMKEFQDAANAAFIEFEKKGGKKDGSPSKKSDDGVRQTKAGETN